MESWKQKRQEVRVRTFQTAMTAVKSGTKKGHDRVCCETNSQGHHRHFLPCRSQAAWSSGKLEPQADPVGRLRWVQLFPLEMQNVAKCCKMLQNPTKSNDSSPRSVAFGPENYASVASPHRPRTLVEGPRAFGSSVLLQSAEQKSCFPSRDL